ncbi:peptidase domain-containing ABC transporter [Calothrix sp. UHCC 0171]|uniref:peptidase domain-containing ABC transporter n=1 Tax=Calothrix sp. UHCC 0171 TaxID=3110245 RepID=UPI002B215AE6|nr:peptidase domain-containing ABC transporter [Calothrix sp. UHCC 0171]MEA5570923.1 peptidase domain-containing ABC transporter [Calothrix sp. UHCC 0171]
MNFSPLLQVQGEHQFSEIELSLTPLAAIHQLLKAAAGDTNLASDLSQVGKTRKFELGDDLTHNHDVTDNDTNILSVVCQGRVRLLGYNMRLGREVSTQLLSPGESFGGDKLFDSSAFSYRAIAASKGSIVEIGLSHLHNWLQQIPNLQSDFEQIVEFRQRLIFFKTMTELHLYSSQKLQNILPHFIKTEIKAGESLQEFALGNQGRFWLKHGSVCTSSSEAAVPQIGESWGYPTVIPPVWSVETDLLVYYLPAEHCQLIPSFPNQIKRDIPRTTLSVPKQYRGSNPQMVAYPEGEVCRDGETQETKSREAEVRRTKDTETSVPSGDAERLQVPTFPARRYPFIRQQSSSDCGATCLAMVCLYWGKRISINTLRNLARTNRTGATLPALVDAAIALGYEAAGVRASLSILESQTHPWIAHWQGIHYVVVWQIRSDRITISDPAIGKRILHRDEFTANWTGYALIMTPTARLQQIKNEKISLQTVWQTFWHYRRLLAQITLASVILQIFWLIMPLIAWIVIDQVITAQNYLKLNLFALGFLLFGVWRLLVRAVRQYLLDYLSNHLDMNLLGHFIRHTLELPLQFFTSRQVGDIITRVEENRKIQSFLTRRAVIVSVDALMAIACFGAIACYNLQLALLTIGLTVPVALFSLTTSPAREGISREIAQQTAAQNTAIVEMITGIATIKAAAAERWVRWHWEERFANAIKAKFQGQRLANNLQLVSNTINHLGTTVLLWCAAMFVMQEQLSVGQFVAFNMLASSISNPVLALLELRSEYQEVIVSMERLNDVLETPPESNLQQQLEVLPKIRGEVQFENVTFCYGSDKRDTLQNISFRIPSGQTIGIVGTSGAGKTTLVNLLAGLYQPTSGKIYIDGYDIAEVSPQSLRAQLGIVPQESFLFSGTIWENITLFNSEFSLENAIASAKLAAADNFIQALPLGYSTPIGARGRMLSGGQKQQIAIARALIRHPPILILDEATSHLDVDTESQIQQHLSRLTATTFIVTHRANLLQDCDRIFLFDRGIILAQGTHKYLIAENKLYSHLIQQHHPIS